MANGTIHKLGTLYINSQPIKFPTKPWSGTNAYAPENGDLYNYNTNKGTVTIGNTHVDNSYKLQWVEVNDGADKLLICDRNILCNISREQLEIFGFVKKKGTGNTITIDNKRYELFMLTGGTNWDVPQETIPSNEWSKYIVNLEKISGLPVPTYEDLDDMGSESNFTTAHNQIWHWAGCYSWCEESPGRFMVPTRGSSSCKNWAEESEHNSLDSIGWRPALRVLEPEHANRPPQILPDNQSLGNLSEPQNISYSISDPDGDYFNAFVYIDNVQKESYNSQTGNKNYTLELSRYWRSLNIGSHKIEIYAVDNQGLNTSKIYNFNKINSTPTITPSSQYLGSLTQPRDFNFTIYDADNDKMSLVFKIDREMLETWSQQSGGQKNCALLTKYWSQITLGSHTFYITATDPYGNSATATYSFDKKNNLPAVPTILSPLSNGRVSSDFYVEFNIGEDPEGNNQTISVKIADNQTMNSGLQEFNQIEKYNGSSWVSVSGPLTNSDVGSKFRAHLTGISSGTKYICVSTLDSGSGQTVSTPAVKITVGESYLEVMTHPSVYSIMPNKIIVLLSLVSGSQAQKEILVSNNANDSAPTWETYRPDQSGIHTFTNKTKTASDWAVSAKIKITANGYTGEISLSAIGLGVL